MANRGSNGPIGFPPIPQSRDGLPARSDSHTTGVTDLVLGGKTQSETARLHCETFKQRFLNQAKVFEIELDNNFQSDLLVANIALKDLRVFGIELRESFQTDVEFSKNAVIHLRDNMEIIDEKLLQKSVAGQWFSKTMKTFYRSVLTKYTDKIADECIVNNQSSLRCGGTIAKNSLYGLLNAFNPVNYARGVSTSYVAVLETNEVISRDQAKKADHRIGQAAKVADIIMIVKDLPRLLTDWKAVNRASVTKKGMPDKRFTGVKDATKNALDPMKNAKYGVDALRTGHESQEEEEEE